jgi:pterin-4a-carbinolamine dehydratase
VLLAAESDIQTAYNHFEDFKEGFGLKFIQDLELAYEYLRHHPRIGRLYKSNRRVELKLEKCRKSCVVKYKIHEILLPPFRMDLAMHENIAHQ